MPGGARRSSSPAIRRPSTSCSALRDEAHRFAITYHRKLREKRGTASLLDEIPGIVPSAAVPSCRRSPRGCHPPGVGGRPGRHPGITRRLAEQVLENL